MNTYRFGTVIEFKKDLVLHHITFKKGERVKVAYHDHKYGVEFVHPQIMGIFEFQTNPMTAKEEIDEYFEVVEVLDRKSIEEWVESYVFEREEWTAGSVMLFAARLIDKIVENNDAEYKRKMEEALSEVRGI